MVEALGGTPGRFVVASMTLAILWFPARLLLDDGPLDLIIARSGLYGAAWAVMVPVFEWINRHASSRRTGRANRRTVVGRAYARRGALVGLGVGVPFYGGLLAFCLGTGRSWSYTVSFGVILVIVVLIAVARSRRGVSDEVTGDLTRP